MLKVNNENTRDVIDIVLVFLLLTILTWKALSLLKKIIEIQGWLLLTFFICLHNQLSSFDSIIVQIINFYGKTLSWLLS